MTSDDFIMAVVKLNQPIKVLARFTVGQLKPCKFAYKGRTYEIETINGSYLSSNGRFSVYSFAVQTKQSEDIFELAFYFENLNWVLKKIVSEDFT